MEIHRAIAVLGSDGQLGSELVGRLGDSAVALTRRDGELSDARAMRSVLLRLAPTAVINAAGYTQVDRAEQEVQQCMRVNADAVEALAGICAELDCPLVQISSDYVFGGDTERLRPYREDDRPAPVSVYGRSKWAGEQAAATWKKHLIVRTCGLYGPRNKPQQANFVDTILRLADERDLLRVVNDQRCTPSYVRDVAAAVLFLLDRELTGIYHAVNTGSTSWYDFAREVLRLRGKNTPIEPISSAQFGARAARPGYSVLDTAKYHLAGGPAMPSWAAALAECLVARPQSRT
jgi:dTDP-4-dehydrorhamnose reductase